MNCEDSYTKMQTQRNSTERRLIACNDNESINRDSQINTLTLLHFLLTFHPHIFDILPHACVHNSKIKARK